MLTSFEVYETLAGAVFSAHRSFRATIQNRRKIGPTASSTELGAHNAFGQCSGVVRERVGDGSGRVLAGLWPLLDSPGDPKIGPGTAFGPPGSLQSASRRVPETALSAHNHPKTNFHQFSVDLGVNLGGFFVDFRSFFVRLSRCAFCFFFARSLASFDQQNAKGKKKNGQVSRSSCVAPLELAHRTVVIHPTACEPTLYTFGHAVIT